MKPSKTQGKCNNVERAATNRCTHVVLGSTKVSRVSRDVVLGSIISSRGSRVIVLGINLRFFSRDVVLGSTNVSRDVVLGGTCF